MGARFALSFHSFAYSHATPLFFGELEVVVVLRTILVCEDFGEEGEPLPRAARPSAVLRLFFFLCELPPSPESDEV